MWRAIGRYIELELSQTLLNLRNLLEQLLVGDGLGFSEDGRQVVVVARLDALYLTCIDVGFVLEEYRVVDGREGLVVEHLG